MRNGVHIGWVVAGVLTASLASAQGRDAAATETLTYEQFMRDHSLQERFTMFTQQLSPEKKANLMGTHYARCLATLGPTLTPEQTAIVRDAQAALSADVFRMPPVPAATERMRDVETRARAAFPQELGVRFFTLESECKAQ